ncbi:MAG: hypothetical protein KDD45_18595, partial [Bdellovibrionales bacterium]|nr:hypothetical protein [Bdellovibrionales bacterium]
MAISSNIYDLINTEIDNRDLEWEKAFLNALPSAHLGILNDTPQTGPDGWPYLMVKIDENGSQSAYEVISWLSDKGIGLAKKKKKE